jgi:hypothetical protein
MAEPLNHHNPELVTWKYEEILFRRLWFYHQMEKPSSINKLFDLRKGIFHWRMCSALAGHMCLLILPDCVRVSEKRNPKTTQISYPNELIPIGQTI